MSTMVGICVSTVIGICAIAVQFYVRWVPDIEIQKRHLKRVASLAWDTLTLAGQAGTLLYSLAHVNGPITPAIVAGISLSVSVIFFCAVLIIVRRWVLPLIDKQLALFGAHLRNFDGLLDTTDRGQTNTDRLIALTEQNLVTAKQHRDAFTLIAKDPKLSVETARALNSLLDSECVSELSPRRLLSKGAAKKTRKSLS